MKTGHGAKIGHGCTRGCGHPPPRRTLRMGWARRGFRGLSRVPRALTELCRAAPPSSCPVTSTQWTQCVPAAFLCKNYSCMGRHFILSDLSSSPPPPPSPEGLFSSRLSSKRARDTAGKQSGAKQTFLVRITWIRPSLPFTRGVTCELLRISPWLSTKAGERAPEARDRGAEHSLLGVGVRCR